MAKVTITSILGGHSPTTHFAAANQFRTSLGIDPAQPIDDANSKTSTYSSGYLRPAAAQDFTGGVLNAAPLWMLTNPKDEKVYILDALGSAYTTTTLFSSLTGLSDGGSLSNGLGNGAEYYDNYIYFAKNTTVARYGPLNGSQLFDGDYWGTTLSQLALTNTTYPPTHTLGLQYPNHILKRHSDGRLYIADVTNNQGIIHYIRTTKTSAEGDTNNGSTYGILTFGYGLWPTAMESYGADLAVALYEGSDGATINANGSLRQTKAKIAFWDTLSTNFNKITWVEFPDQFIGCLKNTNGALYCVSGNLNAAGFRITRFAGNYSFQEVWYSDDGEIALPGAAEAILNQFLLGGLATVPEAAGRVLSVGLQKQALSRGVFCTMRSSGGNSSTVVTSVCAADNNFLNFGGALIAGWSKGSGTANNGIDTQGTNYGNAPSVWWSQTYRVGSTFRINKIRFPFAQAMAANMTLDITIYVDDGSTTFTGAGVGLPTLNNSSLIKSERFANLDVQNVQGSNNFFIELRWTGSALLTVGLPIEIDFEIIDEG